MVKTYITLEYFFPNELNSEENLKILLSNFNCDEIFTIALKILNFISIPQIKDENRQLMLCKEYFPNSYYYTLYKLFVKDKDSVIFFRGQLLTLITKIFKYTNPNNNDVPILSSDERKIQFIKSILICSDLWGNENYSILREQLNLYNYAVAFRKGIQYCSTADQSFFYIGRAYHLYTKIFKKTIKKFEGIFLDCFDFNINNYFLCFGYFIISMNYSIENNFRVFDKNMIDNICKKIKAMSKFLILFSKSKKNYYDLTKVEEYCLYNLNYPLINFDNHMVIGDYISFLECFVNGPLFKLKTINIRGIDWFSKFGDAIEKYIIDILKRIYSGSSTFRNRSHYNFTYSIDGKDYEIDWYLENPESIILSEIKCAFLPNNKVLIDNPKKYINVINQRYGISETDQKITIKGIAQLARHVLSYIDGNIPKIRKIKKIFPVLFTYDTLISAPITSKYLISEFRKLITIKSVVQNQYIQINDFLIAPLTVINLRELIYCKIK